MLPLIRLCSGVCGICDKDEQTYDAQDCTQPDCHVVVQPVENRLEDAYKQDASNAEADGACQTDVTFYIAEMSAVIPPAYSPFPFKPHSGKKF